MVTFKKYITPILLIILVPQIVNLLSCWMISSRQMHELSTVVYMGDNSALSRKIINAFENNEIFDITVYAESPDAVPEIIRQGKATFGLIIPKHFTEDLIRGKAPKVMTVVDGSQLSAASFTKIAASDILLQIKSELLQEKLRRTFNMTGAQAESAASGLVFESRLLGNPTRNYLNFLMPGMMASLVQAGLAMSAAASIDREKRRSIFTYLSSKALVYTGIGFLSLMTVLAVQVLVFQVPMRSGILPVAALSLAFTFAVSSVGVMISTVVWDKVFASQVAAIWFLPSSIIGGYTWPLSSMPGFFRGIAWFMPFSHYGGTLRDLLLKGESGVFTEKVTLLVAFGVVALVLGTLLEMLSEIIVERWKLRANVA